MIVPLRMCFKGSRDYLHGTDMYPALLGALPHGEHAPLRLSIHRMAHRQCQMVIPEDGSRPPSTAFAVFSAGPPGEAARGWLEETSEPVTCRVPYDEAPIYGCLDTSPATTVVARDLPESYTPIEVLVAMTKELHRVAFPDVGQGWVFAQLDLRRLLKSADAARLRVTIQQVLAGKFSKSRIESGNEELGSIRFSVRGSP
jgi:hypothetical protein